MDVNFEVIRSQYSVSNNIIKFSSLHLKFINFLIGGTEEIIFG